MFEISDAEQSRINSFIGKKISNSNNELEARLFPNILGQSEYIDYYKFNRILRRLTFPKEKGGFGLRKENVSRLTVMSDKDPEIRESIQGENPIKLYWLSDNINLIEKHYGGSTEQITKKRKDFINLSNYPVRIALSEEKIFENPKFKLLNDIEFPKEYRLQNRISVFTEDNQFRIDFTSVKFEKGRTFKQSNVIHAFPSHEIEIEFIGEEMKNGILEDFLKNVALLLSIYYDTSILIKNDLKKEVVVNYRLLISTNEKLKKSNKRNNKNKLLFKNFITAKPVTLHRENVRKTLGVPNILRNNGVTVKADGMNMLLYVVPGEIIKELNFEYGNMFMVDSNFNVVATGITLDGWDNSLLEGEYIQDGNMFCAYDMLYAKNLDIRNKPLKSFEEDKTSRLSYMKNFLEDVKEKGVKTDFSVRISEKKYLFGNDEEIFLQSKKLWDDRKTLDYHVDGLIYVPATEPYPDKPGTWRRLFKWKPPELNSIDFLIETVKGENKKDKLFPYSEVPEEKLEHDIITQYKKVKLYTTGASDKFNRRTGKLDRKPFPKLFKEIEVPVNSNGQIISRDPLTGLTVEIIDDTIVEFSYEEGKRFPWTPIRVRHEKTTRYRSHNDMFGNFYNVALDIWKSIVNPVTVEMITSGKIPLESENKKVEVNENENSQYAIIKQTNKRLPYQNFHTVFVKKKLLQMVALKEQDPDRGSGYLIDFGVCKGGDLNRWKEIGFKKVVGIDSDIKCVEEAINRYQHSADNSDNVTFLCGDLSKLIFPNQEAACDLTEKITGVVDWKVLMKKELPQKYLFDVVSSQFVIHYFFQNELSLRTYLQNVTDNLKIGGHFVGTTFDGSKVYNMLKRKQQVVGTSDDDSKDNLIWRITKLYENKKFTDGRPNWGMEIDVFVESIGIPHKEYLVSFKYLEKIALEYGLELQNIIPFSDLWKEGNENKEGYNHKIITDIRSMSDDEKKFSFLSSGFIFKKVKNAPDSLFKKILKLQKKFDKSLNKA